ncbi:hypothetical protein GE061_018372 [Apolygus lucorum]|uniref:Uncharacterized protein n=1 Tax=Apolygus lucorum TaxID=248454 RepID=A0A8S9XDV3_APOLU|nr:hypothetical protein GE061_018372 [Apolygus lucorum]
MTYLFTNCVSYLYFSTSIVKEVLTFISCNCTDAIVCTGVIPYYLIHLAKFYCDTVMLVASSCHIKI